MSNVYVCDTMEKLQRYEAYLRKSQINATHSIQNIKDVLNNNVDMFTEIYKQLVFDYKGMQVAMREMKHERERMIQTIQDLQRELDKAKSTIVKLVEEID